MSNVGTAYVIIRAISPALKKDIEGAVTKAAQAAAPAINKAGDDVGKDMGTHVSDSASKETERGLRSRLKGVFGRIKTALEGDADKNGQGLGFKLGDGLTKGISKFKIPPRVMLGFLAAPAIGGALHIIGAYVAGAISLVSAIGPAFVAAGAVGLGGLAALQLGLKAVTFALKTKTPELDRFTEVLRAYKLELAQPVQDAVLPKLGAALATLRSGLPGLGSGLAKVGGATAQIALNMARTASESRNASLIGRIFAGSATTITSFGRGLNNILVILLNVLAAVQPITNEFARFFALQTGGIARMVQASVASGRFAAFLERAANVARQLGRIAANLGLALFNVFRLANPAGNELLYSIEGLTQKFLGFTRSASGQNSLRRFFAGALPIMHEVNGLIGDILKLIGSGLQTSDSGGTLVFVQSLRTSVVPALSEMGKALSASGPGLANLVASIADLAKGLADTGALGTFTQTLTLLVNALSALLRLPGASYLAGIALAAGGAAKAFDLVLKPVGGLHGAYTKLFAKNAEGVSSFGRITGAISTAGGKVADLSLKVATSAQTLGRATLDAVANFGRQAAAAAASAARQVAAWASTAASAVASAARSALAAAGVVAGWVLMGVQALAGAARVALAWLVSIGPIALVIAAIAGVIIVIVRHWDSVKRVTKAAWDAVVGFVRSAVSGLVYLFTHFTLLGLIISHFNQIVGFIRGLPGRISSAAAGMWDGIKNAFKSAINWIIDHWNSLQFKLPTVDTHIPGIGKVGGFTLGTPDIPRLARGGVIPATNGGSLFVGGEAGRDEAVIPLDEDPRTRDLLGKTEINLYGSTITARDVFREAAWARRR